MFFVNERWLVTAHENGEVVGAVTYRILRHGGDLVADDLLITSPLARALLLQFFARHVDQVARVLATVAPDEMPEIYFALDSLTDLTRRGDTIQGKAVGTLTFRDRKTPTTAAVKAFHDAGGMRVTGMWRVPAKALVEMTPKLHYLGLGVNTNIWHDFFMGFDLVFRPEGSSRRVDTGGSN